VVPRDFFERIRTHLMRVFRPIVLSEPLLVGQLNPNRQSTEACERSLSVISNFGEKPCFLRSLRISHIGCCRFRCQAYEPADLSA
jgi:hypothetical protein